MKLLVTILVHKEERKRFREEESAKKEEDFRGLGVATPITHVATPSCSGRSLFVGLGVATPLLHVATPGCSIDAILARVSGVATPVLASSYARTRIYTYFQFYLGFY